MYSIQKIKAKQTWWLRQQILRPHLSLDECQFNCDVFSSTFHLGAFDGDTLVGIATFINELPKGDITNLLIDKKNDLPNGHIVSPNQSEQTLLHTAIDNERCWRLRGMATALPVRNQGIGQLILAAAQEQIRTRMGQMIWCNARVSAMNFYFRQGFFVSGGMFNIDGIGPHCIMYKILK